jgi:rubrerythrin
MDDREERIRQRAYAIWESEGRPEGEERRHWEKAERELAERDQRPPSDATNERREEGEVGTVVAPSTAPRGKAGQPINEP